MQFVQRCRVAGAEVQTGVDQGHYSIRIEATPRAAALLFALGVASRYIGPEEDSGRAWYQFEYSDPLDTAIKELVDFSGDVVYNQPAFGQLVLFDAEEVAHG